MANRLRDESCISGIGETRYCFGEKRSEFELALAASLSAIDDAGLKPGDIDGIIYPGLPSGGGSAAEFAINLGIRDLAYKVSTKEYGGSMCIAAVETAMLALASGICNHVLIPHAIQLFSNRELARTASASASNATAQAETYRDYYAPYGMTGIFQFYAWHCQRHMSEFGTTHEQLADVALAARRHAGLHPDALLRDTPLDRDSYFMSPWATYPYRFADGALETDGGAAVVLSRAERAADLPHRPVFVNGAAAGTPFPANDIANFEDFFQSGVTLAARRAFAMADFGPADLQFAQIYDIFTFHVITHLEEIGVCPRGEGGSFVEKGAIELGGRLPVNTHGGNLAHASCQAMNHLCEAVRQLRGVAGDRQVSGAERGAVVGFGGGGHGAVVLLRN
jgi:acetyl-CoA acetyltransferase